MFHYTMSSMKNSKRIMWALPIMFAISIMIMNAMQAHAQINPITFRVSGLVITQGIMSTGSKYNKFAQ